MGPIFGQPPDTPKRIVTDTYFGKDIDDPYRWLENVKDPEVLKWLGAQNGYTRSVLDRLPERAAILARIRQLDSETPPPLVSFVRDAKGRYYFFRSGQDGLPKGFVRDPRTDNERLLIDPTTLAAPGQPPPKVSSISPSPDGRFVAFLVTDTGRTKVYTMDVATRSIIGMPVPNVLGFTGLDWDPDSKSLYLVKLPALTANMTASEVFLHGASYRHVVGSDPASDQAVLLQGENRGLTLKPTNWPFVFSTPDGRFLAVWIEDGVRTGHALYVAPRLEILNGMGSWKKIADFDDGATGIVFHGSDAFITAPRGKHGRSQILRVNVKDQDISNATTIELPTNDISITGVEAAADALFITGNEGSSAALYRVPYAGKTERVKAPIEGTIVIMSVNPKLPGGLFQVVGWTKPAVTYRIDKKGDWVELNLQPTSNLGKTLDLKVESVSIPSYDGVSIPLTIIFRRGLELNSSNPTYLNGYGSYGATLAPSFDNSYVPWFEAGGVLAFAHVRGGGELGEEWHMAGSKDKKANTWLDFIACAKYLIDQKYTSSARLAGGGISAGGILIGRSITERPDLFAAALISVGTTDMLRAEYQMNGPANVVEFGTTKDKVGFEQLFEMSAYHHVKDGVRYPAVLLSTGMKDPNVDVWQPGKMAARLQAASVGSGSILLRVDPEAGHDHWGSTRRQIEELRADQLTFLLWQLGIVKR